MRFPKKHVLNGTTCQDQRHLLIDRIAFAAAMPLLEMRIWRMRIPRDFAMEIPGTYWKMMENVDLFPPNFLILWTDVVKSIKPKPLMVYAIGFTIWSLKKTKFKKNMTFWQPMSAVYQDVSSSPTLRDAPRMICSILGWSKPHLPNHSFSLPFFDIGR